MLLLAQGYWKLHTCWHSTMWAIRFAISVQCFLCLTAIAAFVLKCLHEGLSFLTVVKIYNYYSPSRWKITIKMFFFLFHSTWNKKNGGEREVFTCYAKICIILAIRRGVTFHTFLWWNMIALISGGIHFKLFSLKKIYEFPGKEAAVTVNKMQY